MDTAKAAKAAPTQLRFDYGALDTETRRFVLERTERIHNLARMTATAIVQVGQYLTEVKARLGRGEFLKWIEREFAWTPRSAQAFMNVHAQFKNENFSHLEIDISALYLIAAPSTPEPVRTEVMRRAKNGEAVNHAGTRALVERFAETGEIPKVNISLPEVIAQRRRQALESPNFDYEANQKLGRAAQQQREEERRLQEAREANTARVATVMTVIQSINCLAKTTLSAAEIAAHIDRFDTPHQDWRGNARRAYGLLKKLAETKP